MATRVRYSRIDTAANFASANAVYVLGEITLESDTGYEKVGDGTTAYNSLPYRNQGPLVKTASSWSSANPVLPAGQIGFESDTAWWKIGDGSTAYNSLKYMNARAQSRTASSWSSANPVLAAGQLAFESDTGNFKIGDGTTTWNSLAYASSGSGSGTGSLTFLFDDFESDTTASWPPYADAAGTTPVDGTGGIPHVTIAQSADTSLIGAHNLLITKDAVNRQGEGIATNFSIDSGALGQACQIELYCKSGGSYVSGDAGVYLYDVTNGQLVPLSTHDINIGGSPFIATFWPTTSTSYRLIVHVQSMNASAWTLRIDNVAVSVKSTMQGFAGSDWQSFSWTVTGSPTAPTIGTATSNVAKWRRVGADMEIMIHWVGATVGAANGSGQYKYQLPPGYTIDVARLETGDPNAAILVGTALINAGNPPMIIGAVVFPPAVSSPSYNSVGILLNNYTGATPYTVQESAGYQGSAFFNWGSIIELHMQFKVPIAQWSVNINTAEEFQEWVYNTSTATGSSDTTSFARGQGGALIRNITTGINRRVETSFDIGSTDKVYIEISPDGVRWFDPPYTDNVTFSIDYYHVENSVSYGVGRWHLVDSRHIDVSFGTYCDGETRTTLGGAGRAWSLGAGGYYWRVRVVHSNNLAEVPPVVRAEYYSSDASAINTPINFATKSEDTNNNVVTGSGTWRWTCAIPGVYLIALDIWAAASSDYALYINGASYRSVIASNKTSNSGHMMGAKTIRFKAGDYMDIRNTSGTNLTSSDSTISITRIGA